jgi:PAS domain S-box-containing protein
MTLVRGDGSKFEAELSSVIFTDTLGEVRTNMVIRDLTEKKLLNTQLQRVRERLNQTLESMTDAFILLDSDWRVIYMNDRAIKRQEKTYDQIAGKSHWEIWPMTVGTEVEAYYRSAAADGKPVHFEHHYYEKGKYDEWHDIHVYPSEEGLAIYYSDITPRKKAEEALRKLNADLEKRVRDRTAELEKKNRELETFAYSVSHDLKAPLRGIDGYGRLLEEHCQEKIDGEGRLFLENIRKATRQMSQLIDDLLEYSRLERRTFAEVPVNLEDLVSRLLKEREEDLRNIGFTVTTTLQCADINTDADGLVFALRNILDNAIKFTREVFQPSIHISSMKEKNHCIICIEDNGIGFDMKFSEKIFETFQRLHRAEEYPGTGIGLAIARKVMERIGGRTWAEAEPGKGAKFYLEVPL